LAEDDNLSESQASSANSAHTKILRNASYAATLYHVTEEEKYAQFSADILWFYIEQLESRIPSNTSISGSAFYDPRCSYPHFAIAYDFMVNFLKDPQTRLYQQTTGDSVVFDNAKAQKAILNIASKSCR